MKKKTILYLDKVGKAESGHCLAAAAERAHELELEHVVVATTSGRTALGLARELRKLRSEAKVIGVAYAENYARKWGRLDPDMAHQAEGLGADFIRSGHAMGGINTAISDKFLTLTPNKLIAQTYYTLGQGFKVAVEVALMAADQGMLPHGEEVMALGGTGEGADTAIVLTPACSAEFFSVKIHEIVCMTRRSGKK
ncbi:MAG: pyruvate kinase alpha/beta domain-containing protein [Elusimicrobiota bacterium]